MYELDIKRKITSLSTVQIERNLDIGIRIYMGSYGKSIIAGMCAGKLDSYSSLQLMFLRGPSPFVRFPAPLVSLISKFPLLFINIISNFGNSRKKVHSFF